MAFIAKATISGDCILNNGLTVETVPRHSPVTPDDGPCSDRFHCDQLETKRLTIK